MRRFAVLVTSLAVVAGLVTIRPVEVMTVSRDGRLVATDLPSLPGLRPCVRVWEAGTGRPAGPPRS